MPREILDQKIKLMLDDILILDKMVENATLNVIQALEQHDVQAARQIYQEDAQINARRFELENICMITIATQQPLMAKDLRLVASILEVVSELERMGDYAKGIAQICLRIGRQPHFTPLINLPRMAEIAVDMLHRAVGAFVAGDVDLAHKIPLDDDLVDDLYKKIYHDLITTIIAEPAAIDQSNLIIWAAHNLERLADRVTNICERTIYVATGELIEIDIAKDLPDAE